MAVCGKTFRYPTFTFEIIPSIYPRTHVATQELCAARAAKGSKAAMGGVEPSIALAGRRHEGRSAAERES